jgi:hypothetical protein
VVPPAPLPTEAPAPLAASTIETGNVLNEDIYKRKVSGKMALSKEEADNIQTIEDLLDFATDVQIEGRNVINDLIMEIVLALSEENGTPIHELVKKGDKIRIDMKYGESKKDSVGLKVNKNAGSDAIALMMTKDSKIIPGTFNTPQFNRMLIYYRNSLQG